MKCVIPGSSVKVFGRAIHSLSKIGEELYFEPVDSGLALRTVNGSRSAYACYLFGPTFFLQYEEIPVDDADSETETLKCKIGMKSCLSVFKSLSTLEKTVEKCKIKMDLQGSQLVFQLYCKHGIVKTYNIAFIECETLQAVFSKDLTPNKLVAPTRLLCDVVTNFTTSQEEVSLIVDPQRARVKNYVEDEPDANKVIHTELSLDPDEFDTYQVGVDTEVTFCLKELRAILTFAEPASLPLAVNFETSGMPIIFSLECDMGFEATFVLATLADKGGNAAPPKVNTPNTTRHISNASQASHSHPQPSTSSHNRTSHSSHTKPKPHTEPNNNTKDTHQPRPAKPIRTESQSSNHEGGGDGPSTSSSSHKSHQQPQQSSRHSVNGHVKNASRTVQRQKSRDVAPDGSGDGSNERSPVIPVQTPQQGKRSLAATLGPASDSETEDEEDLVPGTPPGKRFRSMFGSFSQSTVGAPTQNPAAILAEDTDDED